MKIATWNVNSLKVRLEAVTSWLSEHQPDVLALQEIKMVNEDFPEAVFTAMGYHSVWSGQKTYNGVAILSRLPASDIVTDFPGFVDPQRRILDVTIDDTRILNLYVPNGSEVGSEKFSYKLTWLNALYDYLRKENLAARKTIILGDFNIAPTDLDVHEPLLWNDTVLCAPEVRNRLQGILDLGFVDTYRQLHPEGRDYSWWDYRQAAFRRNLGLRIDLVLGSLSTTPMSVIIDKTPRMAERPSDHTPVMVTYVLN